MKRLDMKMIKVNYFTIAIILLTGFSSHAQESLFKSYVPILEKAFATGNTEELLSFRKELSSEQNGYLDMKHTVYLAKKNGKDDPCQEVRKNALRGQVIDYSLLLFTAENDDKFFSECELINALRQNKNRSKEEKLKGLEILKKQAENGDAKIQYNLALEFGWYPAFKNMDLEDDMGLYMKYMKMAAEQGYQDAHYRVAEGYDRLGDYEDAKIWVEKALINDTNRSNLAKYRWDLAERYEKGKGVKKNLDKALNFYKTAADLAAGVHYYQYTFVLGRWLYEGSGSFDRDRQSGLKYLRIAARSETMEAAEAYCKENGIAF